MAYGICDSSNNLIAAFVAPMSVISNKPVFVSDTLSLKRKTFSRSAQRWEISTNLEPLRQTANDLFVNFVTLGYTSAVNVNMPQNFGVISRRTTTTSTAITASATAINATSVPVTGNTATALLPKGTFVTFAGDTKVYMLTADFSAASGNLAIYPGLRKAIATTAAIKCMMMYICLAIMIQILLLVWCIVMVYYKTWVQ